MSTILCHDGVMERLVKVISIEVVSVMAEDDGFGQVSAARVGLG